MTYIELQAAFETEIGLIDDVTKKPKTVDIEYWLNQGLEQFCKTRYSGLNYNRQGFEQNQKRIDDLRTLVTTKEYSENEITNNGDEFIITLPKNYLFFLGDKSSIIPIGEDNMKCAKLDAYGNLIPQVADTLEATIENIDWQRRNSLSEHRYYHCMARPLRLMQNNEILLYTDNNYKVVSYQLKYLRLPNEINIHNNPLAEYTDMPVHTHTEIVKLAARMYIENKNPERYNTYNTEISQME